LGLEYVLAEDEPAEIRAAKMCLSLSRCVVLSRDYDVLTVMDYMLQPIKVSGRAWVIRLVSVNRACLLNNAKPKQRPHFDIS
jgi:hypothetical protein